MVTFFALIIFPSASLQTQLPKHAAPLSSTPRILSLILDLTLLIIIRDMDTLERLQRPSLPLSTEHHTKMSKHNLILFLTLLPIAMLGLQRQRTRDRSSEPLDLS